MADEVTIDELAAQVGMTVRNIRAHQARGLLPPPKLVGRVGRYGPLHRQRLEQIRQMQDEGLNLAAIARILNDGQLTAISTELFRPPAPRSFPLQEVLRRLGEPVDGPGVRRAVELGFVEIDGDVVHLRGPGLLAVGEELAALGVPLAEQVELLAVLHRAMAEVAQAHLAMGDRYLFDAARRQADGDATAFEAAMTRMRDLARLTVLAAFEQAMATAMVERFDGVDEDPPATT